MSSNKASPRACFLRPDIQEEAYFFKNDQYVRIHLLKDTIEYGPAGIKESWPPLRKCNWDFVTNTTASAKDPHDVYFSNGKESAFIKVIPEGSRGYVMEEPTRTDKVWPILQDQGWSKIDAACQVNGGMYFFKGHKFIFAGLNDFGQVEGVIEGPKSIRKTWEDTGFRSVDCVLPSPGGLGLAYLFSGTKVALVELSSGEVYEGPHEVADRWTSLGKAGFY